MKDLRHILPCWRWTTLRPVVRPHRRAAAVRPLASLWPNVGVPDHTLPKPLHLFSFSSLPSFCPTLIASELGRQSPFTCVNTVFIAFSQSTTIITFFVAHGNCPSLGVYLIEVVGPAARGLISVSLEPVIRAPRSGGCCCWRGGMIDGWRHRAACVGGAAMRIGIKLGSGFPPLHKFKSLNYTRCSAVAERSRCRVR